MSVQSIGSSSAGMLPGLAPVVPAATPHPPTAPTTVDAAANTTTAQAVHNPAKPPSAEDIQDAVKKVQKAVAPLAQELLFSIDKDTGRTVVKVMDTATKKVVRQIPTEEILEMAKSISQLQDKFQGLLVQQKA